MYVCIFIKLHITAQSGPALSSESFYATRIDPSICMYVLFIYVCMYICMYVCMYVCIFIKLHITAQSGPVVLVILCHSH